MSVEASTGFLIASLAQAAVVFAAEALRISSLNPKVPLLLHILIGQAAGYLLIYIFGRTKIAAGLSILSVGIIYGFVLWVIVMSIASRAGAVNPPWYAGSGTVWASAIAFFAYGWITAATARAVMANRLVV